VTPIRQRRIAFAGFGRQAREYLLPAVRQRHGGKVYAFTRHAIAPEVGLAFDVDSVTSLSDLVACQTTHLFIVASRTANRLLLREAIERGVPNIFVEKPPTDTLSELVSLNSLAAARGVQVTVGMNFRHAPLLADAIGWVDAHGGLVDTIVEFSTSPIETLPGEYGVRAAVLEFGLHAVDLFFRLTGAAALEGVSVRSVGDGWRVGAHALNGRASGTLRIATHGSHFHTRVGLIAGDGTVLELDDFGAAKVFGPEVAGAAAGFPSAKGALSLHYPPRRSDLAKNGYSSLVSRFLDGAVDAGDSLGSLEESYRFVDYLAGLDPMPFSR